MNFKNNSGKSVLIPILVFPLVFVIGFVAVLATRIYDPVWNPFRPKPEKVIGQMISEMGKVKTRESKLEASVKLDEEEIKLEVNGKIEGKEDKSIPEKLKLEQKFELAGFISLKPIGMGIKIDTGGEIKKFDEKMYLKLTHFSPLFFLEMLGVDFSKIKSQWIRIDEQSFEELINQLPPKEREKFLKDFKEEREKRKVFQKEVEKKIKKIVSESKVYFIKKQLPDEQINGVKVYHYLIGLNKQETLKILTEILEALKESSEEIYGESFFKDEKEIKERLEEFFEKIGEIEAELWIGKNDYLLYRLKGEKFVDLSKIEEERNGLFSIKLIIENSEFNRPVKIEEPSGTKTLKEILPLFSKFFEKL